MSTKKILFVGPISDFGGLEIMTNLLACSLQKKFDIQIVSTISMSKCSAALKGTSSNWDTINYFLFRKNWLLKSSAKLTKLINSREEPAYNFINNKISKNYFNFEKLYHSSLIQFIKGSNCVIYSGEINGKWFEEIFQICAQQEKPLVLNLTRDTKIIPNFLKDDRSRCNILVHSLSNMNELRKLNSKVSHIRQTTILEKDLLNLKISEKLEIVYGYLGRFSKEKGVLELLESFSKTDKKMIIAGNGPQLEIVQSYCSSHPNLSYIGQLAPEEIASFFSEVDVFIISSYEEGGPIVGVEAMAAGKLIVSTKVGAMDERLLGTGNDFWFDIEDPNTLDLALDRLELLSAKERQEIQIAVRNKYINYNSLNVIKAEYLKFFEKLLIS